MRREMMSCLALAGLSVSLTGLGAAVEREFAASCDGEITYTLQGGCFGFKNGANPFWAPGHGAGMRTVDQNAK